MGVANINKKQLAVALLVLAALSGCTTQVSYVRVREPLEEERIRDVKVVAVLPFRNTSGDPGASGIVESAILAGIQDFFKAFGRKHTRELEMERGFNESDMVDPSTRQKVRMTGADTAICGEVMKHEFRERRGVENIRVPRVVQEVYFDNRGRKHVRLVTHMALEPRPYLRVTATASIAIHVIRLADGATLVSYSKTLSAKDQGGGASDRTIASVEAGSEMLNRLTAEALHGFLAKIIKTRVIEHRTLDKYWGDGVKAAENGDWEIASRYFWARYLKNKDRAQTLNNVAACIEATADNDPVKIEKAVELYKKALELDYEDIYSRNLKAAQAVLDEVRRHTEASGNRPR